MESDPNNYFIEIISLRFIKYANILTETCIASTHTIRWSVYKDYVLWKNDPCFILFVVIYAVISVLTMHLLIPRGDLQYISPQQNIISIK